jgi:hypothetical protein
MTRRMLTYTMQPAIIIESRRLAVGDRLGLLYSRGRIAR